MHKSVLAGLIAVTLSLQIWAPVKIAEAAAGEKRLTLKQAVSLAMENNHEIRAARSSLLAQGEDVGIARSYLLPKITFEERFIRTANPTYAFMAKLNQERFGQQDFAIPSLNNPNAVNDFQTSFSLEQPLFAKKSFVGLDMAKREFSARGEDLKRKIEEVTLEVSRTFLTALTAREYVSVAERALQDALEHRRIAELRYNNGLGLYSDTLRASTAVTEAEQKLVTTRKNLDIAQRALGLLLGTADSVEPADREADLTVLDISHYDNAAMSRRDVRSMELRSENARSGIKFAEAGYFPMIGAGAAYQLNDHRSIFGAEGQSWQVTAFLRWDLFDGTKREHERTKAKHQAAEAAEHLEGLRKAVSFKVYEAYRSVEEARKNAELALSALKTAEEGKRLVKVRYENSLAPIIDVIDAQVSLDHTRAGVVARENEYSTAVLTLSYESGTILKDLKIEE